MTVSESNSSYAFGPYLLSPGARRLEDADGRVIALRGKGFELLWYLMQNAGRLVTKDELMQAIWPGMVVEENNLSQAMSALRQALGDDAKQPLYLATIKGRGYQFVGEVSEVLENDVAGAADTSRKPLVVMLAVALAIAVVGAISLIAPNGDNAPDLAATTIVDRFADARVELLTDDPGSHSQPALSPTGEMIAYATYADGSQQIWIRNLKQGEPIRITGDSNSAQSPTWTNTGRILFDRAAHGRQSIFSVGILGNSEPQLLVEHGRSPHHAQRADAFVYIAQRNIWIARNNGRDREQVAGIPVGQGFAAREPALSPDGTQIAFIHANEGPVGNVWLISSDGGKARQLTSHDADGGIASSPVWSADGRYIVYTVNADTDSSHLWRVNIESGESAALTVGPGGAREAAISADGKHLAYTAARPTWRLTRIDPVTHEASTLFEGRTSIVLPIASPDRKTIVFFGLDSTGMQLYTIGSDGKNLRQLTFDNPGRNALPTWAGDGKSILYYRDRSLYRLDSADGSDTQVFADFHWSSKNWLDAHGDRITYHNINRPTGEESTVVRGFGEDNEIELPVPIEGAQWSADGKELLGYYQKTGEILICSADGSGCRSIYENGVAMTGSRPKWSPDGSQIYYLRYLKDDLFTTLWRVNLDGTNSEKVAKLPDFEYDNSFFDIGADGSIFYNHVDRSANEVWIATLEVSEEPDEKL